MDFYFFESLFLAFGLIFILEFGDKTQLTSFALAVKYRNRKKVFVGVSLGLISVTSIAVIIGFILKKTIQFSYLKPITALLFFLFGCIILLSIFRKKTTVKEQDIICPVSLEKCSINMEDRKDLCTDANNCKIFIDNVTSKNALFKSFSLIFLAEIGDKSMITAIALSSTPQIEIFGVLLGASLALITVNGLGIYFGNTIMKTSFKDYVEPISGGLFILIALLLIFA